MGAEVIGIEWRGSDLAKWSEVSLGGPIRRPGTVSGLSKQQGKSAGPE
jgi:hypothetical protein